MKKYDINEIAVLFMKGKLKHTEKFYSVRDINKLFDKYKDNDNISKILEEL